eukprot:g1548.t1
MHGTWNNPTSYWITATRGKRYAIVEDCRLACFFMWIIVAIGGLFFGILVFGQGFANGRSERPTFVPFLRKSTEFRYFKNVTYADSLKYGSIETKYCDLSGEYLALPIGSPLLSEFCAGGVFQCSSCVDLPTADQFIYNVYGDTTRQVMIPTALVYYGNASETCEPELYFLPEAEETIVSLGFYVTTEMHQKSLYYVKRSEAIESTLEYTAQSNEIVVELLKSDGSILGAECIDASQFSTEEDGGETMPGVDCRWDPTASSTSTSSSSSSNTSSSSSSTTTTTTTSTSSNDILLTLNNMIRAAGIKSLDEDNEAWKSTVSASLSSRTVNQLSCDCRVDGLSSYTTVEACSASSANVTGTSSVTAYPYRLSGVELVMNVDWNNAKDCAGWNALKDADCSFFGTRSIGFSTYAETIKARITVSEMRSESNANRFDAKPLISTIDSDGNFYELYGVKVVVSGSSNRLLSSGFDYFRASLALLLASILVSVLRYVLELVIFGRCCAFCFRYAPFNYIFTQTNNKYQRMTLKYSWERPSSQEDEDVDDFVLVQRLSMLPPPLDDLAAKRMRDDAKGDDRSSSEVGKGDGYSNEGEDEDAGSGDDAHASKSSERDGKAASGAKRSKGIAIDEVRDKELKKRLLELEEQRAWLRDILLIEAENVPTDAMIDFDKLHNNSFLDSLTSDRADTSFERYLKTRIEALRLMCRDVSARTKGGGTESESDGSDLRGKSSVSRRGASPVSDENAPHHRDGVRRVVADSNLLRIAMLEMYKCLATQEFPGGAADSLAQSMWPEMAAVNGAGDANAVDLDDDEVFDEYESSKKDGDFRDGFRDRFTGDDNFNYNRR